MKSSEWMIRGAHRIVDRVLRVEKEVLNPHTRSGPRIDDVLPDLRRFLASGKVNYSRLRESLEYRRFQDAVAALASATPPIEPRAARAWWINLYNGLIIHAVLEFGIRRSVWEDRGFFRRAAYSVGGYRLSADDIEHGILRGNRRHPLLPVPQFAPDDPRLQWSLPLDPRIHFTLVCAANSCPAISLYTSKTIEHQLDSATSAFINSGGVIVHPPSKEIALSQIFQWYRGDFGGRAGTLQFIAQYLEDASARAILEHGKVRVSYVRYDWTLNYFIPEQVE